MPRADGREAGPVRLTADEMAFMGKLDPRGRDPRIVPGGSEQKQNALRQRCVRRGLVRYRNTGSVFRGWLLTDAGRAALAARAGGSDG